MILTELYINIIKEHIKHLNNNTTNIEETSEIINKVVEYYKKNTLDQELMLEYINVIKKNILIK